MWRFTLRLSVSGDVWIMSSSLIDAGLSSTRVLSSCGEALQEWRHAFESTADGRAFLWINGLRSALAQSFSPAAAPDLASLVLGGHSCGFSTYGSADSASTSRGHLLACRLQQSIHALLYSLCVEPLCLGGDKHSELYSAALVRPFRLLLTMGTAVFRSPFSAQRL